MTIWLLISIAVIALTFALRPLRTFLERKAIDAQVQGELVDEYYRAATTFLQLADPKKHKEMREIVVWVGHQMLQGSSLIKAMLLTKMRRKDLENAPATQIISEMDGLSDKARHAFARATGAALCVSSYQARFMGRAYRSMLLYVINPKEKEIKEPEQIVLRYRKTRASAHSWTWRHAR